MIGGLSPSLALAQRTVDSATARVAKISSQMATGKEVASVKDDGARWAIANHLAGAAKAREVIKDSVSFAQTAVQTGEAIGGVGLDLMIQMRDIALQATNPSLSAQNRSILQTQMTALWTSFDQQVTSVQTPHTR
jgi:flagellin